MMRNANRLVVLALALAGAACATTPPGPPPFDPVGTYDFTTEFQGTAVSGTLVLIRGTDGALRGTLSTSMGGDLPLSPVTQDGRRIEMRGSVQNQGEFVMSVEFSDNDRFAGGWSLAQMVSGTVSGTRRPPPGG